MQANLPDPEQARMYAAAVLAFKKAQEASRENLAPGSPGWNAWLELFSEAIAANDAYIQSMGVNRPRLGDPPSQFQARLRGQRTKKPATG